MERKIHLSGGALDGAILDISSVLNIPRILSLRTDDGKEYHYAFGSLLSRENGVVCTLYAIQEPLYGGAP